MPYSPSASVPRFAVAAALLAVLILPRAGAAQAAAPLPAGRSANARQMTLALVYERVDRANPRARAAAQLARAAEARVPGATRPPDPEIQLGLMNYSLPELTPDEELGMRQLQLMQMLPFPGKLAAAGRAARARADAAGARAVDVRWEERAQAAMAFYDVWAADERIAIARTSRRLLEDVATVAMAMYRVGDGRQSDVLRARVEIARMDEEIAKMEAMREAARARLAAAADAPGDSIAGVPVVPRFPDTLPSRDSLELLALAGRPMISAGEAEVRAASADARLARRERWPDLTVGVQYGVRPMGAMGTDRMASLMVAAALPIFARSRQLRLAEEAAAMQAMADADLAGMRAETRARVTQAYAELASARRLAALFRTSVLPQADAAAASALASYRTGAVDFMTVLDNRMTANRYREELITLTAAEGRAWSELETLAGRPLVDASSTQDAPGGER